MQKRSQRKFIGKVLSLFIISTLLLALQGLYHEAWAKEAEISAAESNLQSTLPVLTKSQTVNQSSIYYDYGNPAGCSATPPTDQTSDKMLAEVQTELGDSINLSKMRVTNIWNGPQQTMVAATNDPFVFEFSVDMFQPPYTYKGDRTATVFLNHGFVVWFRDYDGQFRLLAVPMIDGVLESNWGEYVKAYWSKDLPVDEHIYPVMKKLPCHWMIDEGWVSNATIQSMFHLDWQIPDYLSEGRKYLASNCEDAKKISREQIGYWDPATMCGPLAWTIVRDANSYPYRIGSWYADARVFTNTNPIWSGLPWGAFDPETYDLSHTDRPMPGYDFSTNGNIYKGDLIYSYSSLYASNDERFDHIFLVADVNENGQRISITNMSQNKPVWNCFIKEVTLYTPGNLTEGVINNEWNSNENGRTGLIGFDIFRWKWISYHLNNQAVQYLIRTGDTIETIAFDWKISPKTIMDENHFSADTQLVVGQMLILPATY